jgi:hypothetical protein
MNQHEVPSYGRRDRLSEWLRLGGALLIGAVLIIFELEVGIGQQRQHVNSLIGTSESEWALNRFKDPSETIHIPAKREGTKRFLYLSNSHAKTGGHVAKHLQKLLDRLAPNEFEILDMSDAGIFAPDMLQRLLASLDYDLDGVILAVAYISFSDRMKLVRQSFTARSFFKPSIFPRLPAGFWLRNYDLGIYSETLVAQHVRTYRYRNNVRNLWEEPVAQYLKKAPGTAWVRFLEVDENQSWKFPDGFDSDLFDWSLYAVGRRNHLKDMEALIRICSRVGLPVLASNLPIHWEKDTHQANFEDYRHYRESLKEVFAGCLDYVDYEDFFPKEFTTYDALHPTWHGARLHALDIAVRLHRYGFFSQEMFPENIIRVFMSMDEGISEEYKAMLNHHYPPMEEWSFRRYDISEPANARDLMRRLVSLPVGSYHEVLLLLQLSRRLRYWRENTFDYRLSGENAPCEQWYRALDSEIEKARRRAAYFEAELVQLQSKRLNQFPIPDLKGAVFQGETVLGLYSKVEIRAHSYSLTDATRVERIFETKHGRTISYRVQFPAPKKGYTRVDVLGNGSFIMLQPVGKKLTVPEWVYLDKPFVRWGA